MLIGLILVGIGLGVIRSDLEKKNDNWPHQKRDHRERSKAITLIRRRSDGVGSLRMGGEPFWRTRKALVYKNTGPGCDAPDICVAMNYDVIVIGGSFAGLSGRAPGNDSAFAASLSNNVD